MPQVMGVGYQYVDQALSTNVTRETQTDLQGAFEVPNLRPGTHAVTATLSAFKKAARTGVVLRAASTARADFKLESEESKTS